MKILTCMSQFQTNWKVPTKFGGERIEIVEISNFTSQMGAFCISLSLKMR